jgi:DNA-binding winged helix-turn-helix (wHTH) protein
MFDPGKAKSVRFGDFHADLTTGELFRNGTKVSLQDKPFQILALLLSRPKELVSRHEIIRVVWPDTFVEGDLCLNVAIRRLRAALGEDSTHARFIETVGSRGYRFISSVRNPHTSDTTPHSRNRPRVAIFPIKTFMKPGRETFGRDLTELLIAQLRRMNPRRSVGTRARVQCRFVAKRRLISCWSERSRNPAGKCASSSDS